MLTKTRNILLHGQLQEGLLHNLMQALAVSEAQIYKELAACNKEKGLAELKKRRQYQQPAKDTTKGPS